MATDNERVVRLLFPSGVPGDWQDSPDFNLYLSDLGSYGVDKLCKEPERIAEEKNTLLEQTQELAFSNYKTFIQTANCSREIFKKFGTVESHLSDLVSLLPEFSARCQQFSKVAQDINSHRRLNSLTLSRHPQLLEILELPQLMDTCVRNGYYDEALELSAFTKRLEKKHGSIPVVAGIVKDVQSSIRLMLSQLLAQLRSNLQLPNCLKLIGYLRRLDAFTEAELRLKFLQARDAWLTAVLAALPSDDPYHHISKTVELTRVHLFDVVTQYRAVFSDEDPLLPAAHRDPSISESVIFHSWIARKIWEFLRSLEKDLDRGVGNLLDSLLGQCMYFGLSLGRVGADLRPLLAPVFARAAEKGFRDGVVAAAQRFRTHADRFTLLTTDPSAVAISIPTAPLAAVKRDQLHPPSSLLEFPPLAEYCNGVLTSLNNLRGCAPLCCSCAVRDHLQHSLYEVSSCVVSFHSQQKEALSPMEEESLRRLVLCLARDLLPFLQRCLQVLYRPADLSRLLGAPLTQLKDHGLVVLDLPELIKPLEELLPVTPDEPPQSPEEPILPPNEQPETKESASILVESTKLLSSEEEPPLISEKPLGDSATDAEQ